MLRRKPTRVDLTPEDVADYEALKKKAAEEQKRLDDIEKKKKIDLETRAAELTRLAAKPRAAGVTPTPLTHAQKAAREAQRRQARARAVASRIGLSDP